MMPRAGSTVVLLGVTHGMTKMPVVRYTSILTYKIITRFGLHEKDRVILIQMIRNRSMDTIDFQSENPSTQNNNIKADKQRST
jgi:hypothetical protein